MRVSGPGRPENRCRASYLEGNGWLNIHINAERGTIPKQCNSPRHQGIRGNKVKREGSSNGRAYNPQIV
jgi:hypothetical protein